MSKLKFKKQLLCLTLALSIIGWLCPNMQVSAASANHTHEWGSHEYVESVLSPAVNLICVLYEYQEGGHTYQVQEVVDWCRFYRECYCGERGAYREGGRPSIITVRIK